MSYFPNKFNTGASGGGGGASTAENVSYIPSAPLTATNVQGALDELNNGTVYGPVASTLNAVARYTDSSGQEIKDSSVLIDDNGDVSMASTTLALGAVPSNPGAGALKIYAKSSDGLLYYRDNAGIETQLGGGSNSTSWLFSILTTGAVASTYFRFDNATPATQLVISVENSAGQSMRPLLQQLNMGDSVYMTDSNQSNTKLFTVDDSTDNTTYFTLLVTLVSQTDTATYSDDEKIGLTLAISGNPFDQSLNTTDQPTFASMALTRSSPLLVLADTNTPPSFGQKVAGITTQTGSTLTEIKTVATENHSAGNEGSSLVISTVNNTEDTLTECAEFKEGGIVTPNIQATSGSITQTPAAATDIANKSYVDALYTPENSSTGTLTGGLLSVGTPNTTFSISDGTGVIVGDDPFGTGLITITEVSWTGLTDIPATYIGAVPTSWVGINSAGNVFQSATRFTLEERRDNIYIGLLVHTTLSQIFLVNNQQDFASEPISQLRDLTASIGFMNVSGNNISHAGGTDVSMIKSSGEMFGSGVNYVINPRSPNVITLGVIDTSSGGTFQYRLSDGVNSTNQTQLDATVWESPLGTVASVPVNDFTIQRFYLFSSNSFFIQRGQAVYANKDEALIGLSNEAFVTDGNIADNAILIGYMVIKESVTNLQTALANGNAQWFRADKFGSLSGGSAVSVDLQTAYDDSDPPTITTDSTARVFTLQATLANGGGQLELKNTDQVANVLNQIRFTDAADFLGADIKHTGGNLNISTYSSGQSMTLAANATSVTIDDSDNTVYPSNNVDLGRAGNQWKEGFFSSTVNAGGVITAGNILPDAGDTYDLGSDSVKFRDAHITRDIYQGGTAGSIVKSIGNNSYAVGTNAGAAVGSLNGGVLIGTDAGKTQVNGTGLIAIGRSAGEINNSVGACVFIGHQTGKLATGANNLGIGYNTLSADGGASTGIHNTAIGIVSGRKLETGHDNTMVGYCTGVAMTTGNENTVVGSDSLLNLTTGSNNTIIGAQSGNNLTSSSNNNVMIGQAADAGSSGVSINRTAIGFAAENIYDNSVVIGNTFTESISGGGFSFCDLGRENKRYKDLYLAGSVVGASPAFDTVASAASIAPDCEAVSMSVVTSLSAATLTISNPTGTPKNGQTITIRVKDNGTSRTLAWDTDYTPVVVSPLPTATVAGKLMYWLCMYNSTSTKWDVIATSVEA